MTSALSKLMLAWAVLAAPVQGQVVLDRGDPAVIERDLRRSAPATNAAPSGAPTISVEAPATPQLSVRAGAIIVEGSVLRTPDFADILPHYIGRPLDREGLRELLSAIAKTARARGYLFATATIAPQALTAGVLTVTLDEGRIDAVRSIGVSNSQADRILRQLIINGPITRTDFERVVLLAGDVAGVSVTEVRFVRQNGFGILLVTLAQDRQAAFLQLDNRGTKIVGNLRATALGTVRGIAGDGDELTLLYANTPADPEELNFLQAKYAAPIGAGGTMLWSSFAFGHTEPGAALAAFNVVGDSISIATGMSHPLVRSRSASLWSTVELRKLWLDQKILGLRVRRDRIVTVSAAVEGAARLSGGVLRGSGGLTWGLPLSAVTRMGDALASRGDGDARFLRLEAYADWTRPLGNRLSIRVAGAGQLASRPLLASQEMGLGGRLFARAYDENERSGENGIAGSIEARFDLADRAGPVRKPQFFAFADAGYVDNSRAGLGGGALYTAGVGARCSLGKTVGAETEVAWPLSADRLSTGNRHPRISLRLTAAF